MGVGVRVGVGVEGLVVASTGCERCATQVIPLPAAAVVTRPAKPNNRVRREIR